MKSIFLSIDQHAADLRCFPKTLGMPCGLSHVPREIGRSPRAIWKMQMIVPRLAVSRSRRVSSVSARSRVRTTYLKHFGRFPNIADPRTFTEWVQWRKLHDRSAHHPDRMDKLAAKQFASQTLDDEWVIPTLWFGRTLPQDPPIMGKAMLKARHGCNQNAIVPSDVSKTEWDRLRVLAKDWCRFPYGRSIGEWAYEPVTRGLVIEPFVSDNGEFPVDYKIYVFGGVATHAQVHLGRGHRHRWLLHDRNFRPMSNGGEMVEPPRSLSAILAAAEALAADEDFMRVDFYEVGGKPLFGEFCLYPGSGHHRFALPELDRQLGRLWAKACRLAQGRH